MNTNSRISKVNLRKLRNPELLTFITRFLGLVKGSSALPLSLEARKTAVAQLLAQMESVHKTMQGSELTEVLTALDALRDEQYNGLFHLAAAWTCRTDDMRARAAGERIAAQMAVYGTVTEVTRDLPGSESANIRSLVSDLRNKPELAAAVALIGATPWIDTMDRANNDFETKWQERNQERADAPESTGLADLRLKLYPAYAALCRGIESFNDTEEGAVPWPGIIAAVNALAAETNTRLAARATHAAASSPAATPGA
ncbi:hypothetical protein EPD60_07685 [Flaviaesturariibacter flavus]|uniref:Uncharacterized protein n=1 Tax=Flaviaesturariibacter flavus TaxID=2502780 RepID=A0A4V2NW33_9BACT|nr:DUF6261 family protein [Flaviaesturariibacter flavus]TCJ15832.1 hypothetical protein EPD60_07685 [Flaviaesturariibacter flavus]